MKPFAYFAPKTLDEAAALLREPGARALAGGTDLLVRLKRGQWTCRTVVNLKSIPELRGVRRDGDGVVIGALTTLTELAAAVPVLAETVRQMASEQIRNLATVGGNLCNASPAADLAPPLLCLDAIVRTTSREIPLADFFTGPGKCALKAGEVVTAVRIPRPRPVVFQKLEKRAALDIAVASAAGCRVDGTLRLALGAVAPTPILTDETLKGLAPIDDVRSTAAYRRRVARVLVRRVVEALK